MVGLVDIFIDDRGVSEQISGILQFYCRKDEREVTPPPADRLATSLYINGGCIAK